MRKLRVNIFDDDPRNLKLLKFFLSERDFEILTFDRAVVCPIYDAGTDKCNSLKPCADIIITDYQMPEMTGLEMLLHQAQRGCRIDIRNQIAISSDLDNKGRRMLEELGCAFFSKPLKLNELSAYIEDCEKRIDLSKPLAIKRKECRSPANIDIVYANGSGEKTDKASVINYSSGGLCLKVDAPLAEREAIVIKTELPIACNNVEIRWVKELGSDFYMAGCSCN